MAYEIGTASNYKDLLKRLKAFLTDDARTTGSDTNITEIDPIPTGEVWEVKRYIDYDSLAAGGSNTGNGTVGSIVVASTAPAETWTLTATSATNFTVSGSVSGAQAAATVGTPYDSGEVAFLITAGGTAFVAGDVFTFNALLERELILMGQGTAGTDEIFVGIKTFSNTSSDYFDWYLQGFTGYSAGGTFDSQPGAMTDKRPRMLLDDSAMDYWFVANGRRFIVVAKVTTVYEACYLGFYLPYGTPAQAPYPLMIGGSSTDNNTRWSSNDNGHRLFVDPGDSESESSLRMLVGTIWQHFSNFSSDTSAARGRNVWPYNCTEQVSYGDAPYQPWRRLIQGLDGNVPVLPLILNSTAAEISKAVWGEIQGCYAIPGTGLSPEDTIAIGSDEYIAFPNVWRSNTWNYWALKKE